MVDQPRIDAFADATMDHQWIHVDPARAAAGPFGATIAHGYLTLSVLPALASSIYTIEAGSHRLNYGLNKVRFPAPVTVDRRLRSHATLVGLEETHSGTQVLVQHRVEIEGEARLACVAETITLVVG